MYTAITSQPAVALQRENKASLVTRFMNWAEGQSEARFIWLGVALLAHASFFTPFTVMAIIFSGGGFGLIMAALAAMGLALVTNLAALPTKVTIPAFFISIVVDVLIVALAFLG